MSHLFASANLWLRALIAGMTPRHRLLGEVRVLRDSRRFDEADRIAKRGLAAYPADYCVLTAYAWNAHYRGAYEEAIKRWEAVIKVKRTPIAYSGLAGNARELGQIPRAVQVVEEGLQRFPYHLSVLDEAARIADRSGDRAKGLSLWRRAIDASGKKVSSERRHSYIQDLILLDKLDQARAALGEAAESHSNESWLLALRGMLAEAARE